MAFAGSALVAAESILALTPIAIKKTPLDPISAILSRVISSAVLGYILTSDRTLTYNELAGAFALGYTNLLHVATSYETFRNLPTGQAMSLLYTYPLWNLIFANFFRGEKIKSREYGLIGIASIGSLLLNMDPGMAAPTALGRTANPSWGLLTGIVMALTESGMVTLLKALDWRDPAKSVWVVNSSATLWIGAILFIQELFVTDHPAHIASNRGTWLDAILLTSFHSLTIFSGYWLRFYAVPRLSSVTYAILSYAGLFASYIFGLLILKETPGWMSLIGAAVIVASGLALQVTPAK